MTALTTTVAQELSGGHGGEERGGTLWLRVDSPDVRELARKLRSHNARLITIAASELPEGAGIQLDYHWDVDGQLISYAVVVTDGTVASINDLCEAADWVEREIHEYFALNFSGREYEPLVLRAGDTAGVNLRKEDE